MQQKGDGEPEEQLDGDGHGGEVRGVTERGPESSVLQEEAKVREADEALLVEDDDGAMEAEPRRRENGHDGDAGENSGRVLSHDHVALEWQGPYALGSRELDLPLLPKAKIADSGVVAFVQNRRTAQVLQALALAACAP